MKYLQARSGLLVPERHATWRAKKGAASVETTPELIVPEHLRHRKKRNGRKAPRVLTFPSPAVITPSKTAELWAPRGRRIIRPSERRGRTRIFTAPFGHGRTGGGAGSSTIPLQFSADWSTQTGATDNAISDGGKFDVLDYGASNTQAAVVAGGPLGWTLTPNVIQFDVSPSAYCQLAKDNAVPASTTNWGRAYVRNDNINVANGLGHVICYKVIGPIQIRPLQIYPTGTAAYLGAEMQWVPPGLTSADQSADTGPNIRRHWQWMTAPSTYGTVAAGTWYRWEWMVEFVSALSYRLWIRLYDLAGNILSDSATMYTTSFDTTLANFYNVLGGLFSLTAASYPGNAGISGATIAQQWGLGQANQTGTVTGYKFYFAKVALSLAGWIGP